MLHNIDCIDRYSFTKTIWDEKKLFRYARPFIPVFVKYFEVHVWLGSSEM